MDQGMTVSLFEHVGCTTIVLQYIMLITNIIPSWPSQDCRLQSPGKKTQIINDQWINTARNDKISTLSIRQWKWYPVLYEKVTWKGYVQNMFSQGKSRAKIWVPGVRFGSSHDWIRSKTNQLDYARYRLRIKSWSYSVPWL